MMDIFPKHIKMLKITKLEEKQIPEDIDYDKAEYCV